MGKERSGGRCRSACSPCSREETNRFTATMKANPPGQGQVVQTQEADC